MKPDDIDTIFALVLSAVLWIAFVVMVFRKPALEKINAFFAKRRAIRREKNAALNSLRTDI